MQACEARELAYADDIVSFCTDASGLNESFYILKRLCKYRGTSVNWDKCLGFWHGTWQSKPSVFALINRVATTPKYFGVPLENYRDIDPY